MMRNDELEALKSKLKTAEERLQVSEGINAALRLTVNELKNSIVKEHSSSEF